LHNYVASQESFPLNPDLALKVGFRKAEEDFLKQNQHVLTEKSGSCACVVMILDEYIYIANVGDSRAVISMNQGKQSL